MTVKTQCPHCNQSFEYDGERGGVHITCTACSNQVFLPKTTAITPPILTVQNQQSVGLGVFKGLFGFFVLFPLAILIISLIFLGMVIGGCGALFKARENVQHQHTNSVVISTNVETFSDDVNIDSDDDLIKSGDISTLMTLADSCRIHGCYNRAIKLYVGIALYNKQYPREAAIAIMKIAKYCYMNVSIEKRQSLNVIFGDTFYNDFKNAKI